MVLHEYRDPLERENETYPNLLSKDKSSNKRANGFKRQMANF